MKRILSLLLTAVLLIAMTVPAAAADSAKGGTLRLEESSGTVTVNNASGKSQTIRQSMRLYNGYSVSTGTSSSAYISLDDTKVIKLDSSTKVEVKESGKQLEVALSSGLLFFNVTKPLKADETLNIRTSTMVTGIRGSYGWVKPNEMGLMHGHVTVTCRNPYTGEIRVTEVTSGQRVYFDPNPKAVSADQKLLEIDFVKELIYNKDVPLVVVREMAKDHPGLCAPVIADVPTVDVPKLLEQLPAMEKARTAEEAAARTAYEKALAEEDASIVGDDVDPYFETGGAVAFTGYAVSFDTDGGGWIATQDVPDGSTPTVPADPTRPGHTFTGWYSDAACTAPYDFTAPVTSDTTIYAGWAINTYTVTFDANGHGTAPAAQTITYNEYAAEPAALAETGYTFGGWYTDAACTAGNEWTFTTTPVTDNVILYAKWSVETHTVTFEMNGHGAAIADQTVDYGGYVTQPADPTETGYTFDGWYEDAAFINVFDFTTRTITADTTIYAKWSVETHTVTFAMNGHGTAPAAQTVDYNGYATQPADPTETGYTFGGWYADAGLTTVFDFAATPITADTTIYAKWSVETHTVTFEMNGHGTAPAAQTVDYNGYATRPATDPTETGWTFDNWYADAGLTTLFDFATTPITADTTIYAKWLQVFGGDYISNAPDGSADLTLDMGDLVDGDSVTLTDMATVGWSYAGYDFAGWNTAADGSGTAYTDADTLNVTGDVTLYAQWTYEAVLPATVGYNALYSVYDADDNEVTGATVTLSAGDHGGAVHTFTVRQPAGEAAADFAIGPNFNLTGGTLSAPQTTLDPVDFTFTVTGGPTTVNITGVCYTGGATVPADGTVIEGWLDNYGSVILTNYDAVSYDVTIDANQNLTVNSASATEAMYFGQLNNAGTLQVMSTYGADINDTSTNSGSIIVDAGSSLTVNNALTSDAGSSIDNQGTFVVDGANGELNLSGTMVNGTGGTVTVSGTGALNILTGGIFTNSGAITLSDNNTEFTSSGEFTNESGATVTVNDRAEFQMNGITVNNGTIELTEATTEDTTGGLYCAQGSFTNNGSIIVRNNRLAQFLYQMTVLNSAGASVTVDAGGKINYMLNGSASSWLNEGTITNAGSCTISTGTTDPIPVNRSLIVNSGELNISTRGLDSYEGTIDNTGTINNGGPLYYDVTNKGAIGGTVTGSGEIKNEPAP